MPFVIISESVFSCLFPIFYLVFLRMVASNMGLTTVFKRSTHKVFHIIWAICWLNVRMLSKFGFCKAKKNKTKLGAHHYHIISDLNNKLKSNFFAMLCVSLVAIPKWFPGTQTHHHHHTTDVGKSYMKHTPANDFTISPFWVFFWGSKE